jgi:hypothetical protein
LASEDYLEANKISKYRFIHYDLYREYFRSVNSKLGLAEDTIVNNFDQVFGASLNQQGGNSRYESADMDKQVKEMLAMMEVGSNVENEIISREFVLSPDETKKFMIMGPITQEEVGGPDWDQLADDLTL